MSVHTTWKRRTDKDQTSQFSQKSQHCARIHIQTLSDMEYKVNYSAPKRDITLVEAPETKDAVEWFLPRPDDWDLKHLSGLVPWREGSKMFQDFVDRLPRPPISSADDNDHTCPICKDKYDLAGPGAEYDTAVELECGHTIGSYCLLKWVNGNIEQGCPLCRRTMMLQDSKIKEIRAEDMKRFLFWLLRTHGKNIGIEMLVILEHLKIHQLIWKRRFAKSINHTMEDAEITKEAGTAFASLCHRKEAPFLDAFCERTARRVARSGKSGLEWLRTSMIKAAAECILHRMSGYALAALVDAIIPDPGAEEEIERYVADKEYGPYGSHVDYSDLPGISLGHFLASKPSRRTTFTHGFRSEFPVLLESVFDEDGNSLKPDPDLVLPFPSSHDGTRDLLDGDDVLYDENFFGPVE